MGGDNGSGQSDQSPLDELAEAAEALEALSRMAARTEVPAGTVNAMVFLAARLWRIHAELRRGWP